MCAQNTSCDIDAIVENNHNPKNGAFTCSFILDDTSGKVYFYNNCGVYLELFKSPKDICTVLKSMTAGSIDTELKVPSIQPDGTCRIVTIDANALNPSQIIDNGDGTFTHDDGSGEASQVIDVKAIALACIQEADIKAIVLACIQENETITLTDADIAVSGEPTDADLTAYVAANSLTDVDIIYIGDGTIVNPDYVWNIDTDGNITEIESPSAGGYVCGDAMPSTISSAVAGSSTSVGTLKKVSETDVITNHSLANGDTHSQQITLQNPSDSPLTATVSWFYHNAIPHLNNTTTEVQSLLYGEILVDGTQKPEFSSSHFGGSGSVNSNMSFSADDSGDAGTEVAVFDVEIPGNGATTITVNYEAETTGGRTASIQGGVLRAEGYYIEKE